MRSAPPAPGGPEPGALPGPANPFGLTEALVGLLAGLVLATLAAALFGELSHHPNHPSTFGSDVASLIGLWTGLVGSAAVASRSHAARRRHEDGSTPRPLWRRVVDDYGLRLRPWPDVPLGVAAGFVSQYLLVPLLTLPLLPFVPHLFSRLGQPAKQLTAHDGTGGLVVLGLLVCVGSPLVEELFFRGLLLRGLAGRLSPAPPKRVAVLTVVVTAVVFGLVHFEALQLIGLVGFGVVLGTLAWRTRRLGPGLVAHITFNAVTYVALALSR
jgi:hypothetical protein